MFDRLLGQETTQLSLGKSRQWLVGEEETRC